MLRLLLLALVVAVVVALVLRAARPPRALPPVVDELPAGEDRAAAVALARQRLEEAQQRYDARVAVAQEALDHARQDVEVMRLGPVVLGRVAVLVDGREHALEEGTGARLERSGSVTYRVEVEGEASRIVGDDRRTGRLVLTGEGWREEVELVADDLVDAERLVAATLAAARAVGQARAERDGRVRHAWEGLEAARADRAEVDTARMTVEDLTGSGPWVWDVPEPPEER